jgi:proline iminopeptidase
VLQHFRRSLAGTFDPWPRLDRVTCPVLVLAGEHDPVATVPAARRLTAALTATAPWLRVVPDAGRRLFREYPERARALLGDFLAAHRR